MSGQLQRGVTTNASPLPIQPNGKLLNQTPFILEVKKVRSSYTGCMAGTGRGADASGTDLQY